MSKHDDTIVLAETLGGIPWLEPRDLKVDNMTLLINELGKAGIASNDLTGAGVVLMDGRIERLHADAGPALIKSMIIVKPRAISDEDGKTPVSEPRLVAPTL